MEVIDDGDGFMSFRSLTLVPIDLRLADIKLMSETERQWIDAYHWRVARTMEGTLDPATAAWLAARTAPIGN
ncbi:hypothetical protein D3C87_2172620 [compost metagenome]